MPATGRSSLVTVSILYPNGAGNTFDFDYYLTKHMPRSIALLGAHPGYRGVTVERGVGGTEPGAPPRYMAACTFTFDSIDSFLAAFMPHAEELQGDIPRFTSSAPDIQFNEILIDERSTQASQ